MSLMMKTRKFGLPVPLLTEGERFGEAELYTVMVDAPTSGR